MVTTFWVDSVYTNLVPPQTDKEFAELKESIKQHGLLTPITVNGVGKVLDGHNRLKACQQLGITPNYVTKEFSDPLMEKWFVIEANLTRRQLNDYQRCVLATKSKEIIAEIAKRNMSEGGKTKEGVINIDKPLINTQKELASKAGVSTGTFYKAEKIQKLAPEDIKKKLDLGEVKIDAAYKEIKNLDAGIVHRDALSVDTPESRKQTILAAKLAVESTKTPAEKALDLINEMHSIVNTLSPNTKLFNEYVELEDRLIQIISNPLP